MADPRRPLSERLKDSRFVRVLVIYLGVSWPILGIAGTLQDVLLLPDWVSPATLVVLVAGLVVVLATAWIQSSPLLEKLASVVPESWVIGWREVSGDLRVGRMPRMTWGRAMAAALFTLWLVFGFVGAYVLVSERAGSVLASPLGDSDAATALAVMPFSASGAGSEVYREGMVNLLSTALDGVAGLRAIDSRTVLSRWQEAVAGDGPPDLATLLGVGRETGARYALVGSAVDVGPELGLVADLYDARTGAKLGSVRARGEGDSVMAVVDRLSVEAARLLIAEIGGSAAPVQHLEGLMTGSLTALEAYLEGERHYRAGDFGQALDAYERAVHADSTFALASLRAGMIYGWDGSGASQPDHLAHLQRAARHAERLPPRERALLTAKELSTRDPAAAIARIERDARLYPDDPDLWQALGELYYHEGPKVLLPRADGISALKRAIELEPDFVPYLIHVTEHAISFGDSAEAARWLDRERQLAPDEPFTRAHLHAFTLVYGDSVARAAVLDTLREMELVPGYATAALRGPRRLEAREAVARAAVEKDPLPRHLRDRDFTRINRGLLVESPMGRVVTAVLGLSAPPDPGPYDDIFLPLAAYAAATGGLTAAFEERRVRLSELEEAVKARNPRQADFIAAFRELTVAVATLKEGRAAEAIPLLEASLAEMDEPHFVGTILFLLGEAHETVGNQRTALRHFLSAAEEEGPQSSLALLRAARLNGRLGESEEARALYRDLLVAWEDAGAYFQPWVEEARLAVSET